MYVVWALTLIPPALFAMPASITVIAIVLAFLSAALLAIEPEENAVEQSS
jgi:hypothetical protein